MPRGRPPIGPQIKISCPSDLKAALVARADLDGVKMAEVCRRALMAYVNYSDHPGVEGFGPIRFFRAEDSD